MDQNRMEESMREKIAEIVAIASGVKYCDEERETDLCQINNTLACNRCLTAQLEALFTAETAAMREALTEARPLLTERLTYCTCQSEYNKVQRVIEIVDTVLKGGK